MILKEILAKAILSKSQMHDYTINPYVGCAHACAYCYAAFMKRFTGHREPWGDFVDVKINAAELLAKEIVKKSIGDVWISGVCDSYQPAERTYQLTRSCLEILVKKKWPILIQTKSSLILRDLDILEKSKDLRVVFSIGTADEKMRKIFEPGAPRIEERINALQILHSRGIKTFVMIAPILHGASKLVEDLADKVDHVIIDRVNYNYANRVYREYGMEWAKESSFFIEQSNVLKSGFDRLGVSAEIIF